MMIYIISFNFYGLALLWWLISGLLGLLAGYIIWARWKPKYIELQDEHLALNNKLSKLEGELQESQHRIAMLDGDIAVANGRVREMEALVEEGRANNSSTAGNSGDPEKLKVLKAKVREMRKALQIAHEHAETAKKDLETTKSDLKASDKTNKKWEAKIVELRHELNKLKTADVASKIDAAEKVRNANLSDDQKNAKSGFEKFKINDLKIIEGIGPKIADVLNDNGISTWKDLSNTTAEEIKSMLEKGGNRFSFANPTSWPKQASLAASENWDELAKLQDELDGGV